MRRCKMIGKNIKSRREELGLTQDDLAQKLGYRSRSSIQKIEKGVTDIPQSKIKSFAEALQTTPEYLMGWTSSHRESLTGNNEATELLNGYFQLNEDSKRLIREMTSN